MAVAGARPRTPYAADPERSRGRLFVEEKSALRTEFRRDCDRVIHSTAFRRLKHKTQVFVSHEGDHYRTRLTHTLEVTQIARALARGLGLDEDLTEALALSHDLGHPPFGHAGERSLDQCMSAYGGFDHNAQSLKIVTELERRYARFDGLNLTWETLEGIAKHNGPLSDTAGNGIGKYAKSGVPVFIADYSRRHDLELWSYASAEAQAAAIADDIAYDAHDLDDALRAGLFPVEELREIPLVSRILVEVKKLHGGIEQSRLVNEITRRLIARMIADVIAEADKRIAALKPTDIQDIRNAKSAVVGFSPELAEADRAIKKFLTPRMYRNPRVIGVMQESQDKVAALFAHYLVHPEHLPEEWRAGLDAMDEGAYARRVTDFIAGMTDRFALAEYERFLG
jgi:dGTPase